jgi:hypothetical protein
MKSIQDIISPRAFGNYFFHQKVSVYVAVTCFVILSDRQGAKNLDFLPNIAFEAGDSSPLRGSE